MLKRLIAMAVTLSLISEGCAITTGVSEQRMTNTYEGRCQPPAPSQRAVSPGQVDAQTETEGSEGRKLAGAALSWRALRTADVIEILPLLAEMAALENSSKEGNEAAHDRIVDIRQEMMGRILLAMLEVSGTAAEVDCEMERARELMDRLQKAEGARVKQLTLTAIILGGVAAVVTGGFGLAAGGAVASNVASIVGGTLGGSFGVAALYPETQQDYRSGHNLLREVWQGPSRSELFTRPVWRFFNEPMKEEAGVRTFREELVSNWQQEGRLGTPGSMDARQRKALVFGDGGIYHIEDLQARVHMLGMLRTTINLMNEDLEQLIREVMIRQAIVK
jgi:hypothetical protein